MHLAYTNPNPPTNYKPLVSQFKPAYNSDGAKHYLAVRPTGESYFAVIGGKR
jgi:hypothetical protein